MSWRARWRLKSPASRWYAQPFTRVQIKEDIKAPRQWAFVRGIHWWPVNSLHKVPVTLKMFPFDDIIMKYVHLMNVLQYGDVTMNIIMHSPKWAKYTTQATAPRNTNNNRKNLKRCLETELSWLDFFFVLFRSARLSDGLSVSVRMSPYLE